MKGVGIAVPGVVQPESRTISFAPSLGWENVDLTGPLKAATDLPLCIENRANAAALGEFWCGAGEGRRDLVFVSVRVGIGAGILLGGVAQVFSELHGLGPDFPSRLEMVGGDRE